MKKPFWRKQSKSWVVWLPNGKLKTLGKDPHGATRKNPPPEIVEAWHAMDRLGRPQDMLFSDVAAIYLEYLTNPGSRKTAKEHLDRFIAHAGKVKVSALRVHHVTDFLKTRRWSDSTKATAINRIVCALNHSVAEGHIDDHRVKFPRGKKPRYARRRAIVTPEQQAMLEGAAGPALRVMLVALRESGCRPHELCEARIEDVKGRVMRVPNKVAKRTGEKMRDIYLSPILSGLVEESIGRRAGGTVFLNSFGRPWTPAAINNRVRRIRIKLGLPDTVVPYGIRHGFASMALNDTNANPAHVARLLGHSDLTMLLKHYFHESPEAMQKAIDEITRK